MAFSGDAQDAHDDLVLLQFISDVHRPQIILEAVISRVPFSLGAGAWEK